MFFVHDKGVPVNLSPSYNSYIYIYINIFLMILYYDLINPAEFGVNTGDYIHIYIYN